MNNDLISIIVPIYKVEKYLRECIDSIIKQTYNNLEIILVDDGSPDNSGEICEEYAKNDSRIQVIHKENGGLSDARNAGLDIAKGKYVAFIDSDDYIDIKFVERLYDAIIDNKTLISQCGVLKVDNDKKIIEVAGNDKKCIKIPREMLKELYDGKWENIITCNKLYSKDLFLNTRFPKGKIHEDEFCIYKILYKSEKVAIINENLYNYRKNSESITEKNFSLKKLDRLEALEERLEFLLEKQDEELYIITLNNYLNNIKNYYIDVKKYIDKSEGIQKDLINKYRKSYRKIVTKKYTKFMIKLKDLIFYVSPKLFYKIKS